MSEVLLSICSPPDPGFSNIGADANTDQLNSTNTFTPFGTISKTAGPHNLLFGASLRKNEFNSFNPSGNPEGTLAFSGTLTNHGTTGNANTGLADFLLGKVTTGNYQLPMPETGRRNFNLGVFAQDDWKATPHLTINAGVRYEYESPMTVAKNIYTRFDPTTGQLLAAGINASNSLNVTTPKLDFSPRLGWLTASTVRPLSARLSARFMARFSRTWAARSRFPAMTWCSSVVGPGLISSARGFRNFYGSTPNFDHCPNRELPVNLCLRAIPISR